jgi:hypothetical protein
VFSRFKVISSCPTTAVPCENRPSGDQSRAIPHGGQFPPAGNLFSINRNPMLRPQLCQSPDGNAMPPNNYRHQAVTQPIIQLVRPEAK